MDDQDCMWAIATHSRSWYTYKLYLTIYRLNKLNFNAIYAVQIKDLNMFNKFESLSETKLHLAGELCEEYCQVNTKVLIFVSR